MKKNGKIIAQAGNEIGLLCINLIILASGDGPVENRTSDLCWKFGQKFRRMVKEALDQGYRPVELFDDPISDAALREAMEQRELSSTRIHLKRKSPQSL